MSSSIKDFFKNLSEKDDYNPQKVLRIENAFGCRVSALCAKILSYQESALFFDSKSFLKLLSYEEIIDAEKELQVPFSTLKLIPIFDVGDNDFICFNGRAGCWCIFNVVDELTYKDNQQLESLLEKYLR